MGSRDETRIIVELGNNLAHIVCKRDHGPVELELKIDKAQRCRWGDCSECRRRYVSWIEFRERGFNP